MVIARPVTKVEIVVPTIDSVTEAKQVFDAVINNEVTPKAARDAANGLLEAFFVTHLRAVDKKGLHSAIIELSAQFGKCAALRRAQARVKAFRPKNPAWKKLAA